MHIDWLDTWREINAILSGIALVLTCRRLRRYRAFWTFQERAFLRAGAMFMATSLLSSVESILQDSPFGWRIPLLSIALLMAVYAMLGGSERHATPQKARHASSNRRNSA